MTEPLTGSLLINDVLYLPAGPRFTMKREIKNVVTVIAKTCHYWTAHRAAGRRPIEGRFDTAAAPVRAESGGGCPGKSRETGVSE